MKDDANQAESLHQKVIPAYFRSFLDLFLFFKLMLRNQKRKKKRKKQTNR